MENVNIKQTIKSFLIAFVLFASSVTMLKAQQWTYEENGIHHFESIQPEQNLSFYLFGDGYHSFQQNPIHQYGQPSNPQHYSAEPYEDDDEVEEFTMPPTTGTTNNPTPVNIAIEDKIMIKRSWNLVREKDNYFILSFENNQENLISGCVEFHYNSADLHITESDLLDDYGNDWVQYNGNLSSSDPAFTHKFSWDYVDLEPGEQRHIYINALCIPPAFSQVNAKAIINVSYDGDCSEHSSNNSSTFNLVSFVKNNPHDPNCIVAEPNALYQCDAQQTVHYKVYFHNDGVDPAVNVYVPLEVYAPVSDVKLIYSPDNVDMFWDGSISGGYEAIINFVFPKIYLRGLNEANPPPSLSDTYGYVEFDVCYNLSDFTTIDLACSEINGDIFFDEEAPINVRNEICRVIDCQTGYIATPGYEHVDVGFDYLGRCPSSPIVQRNYELHSDNRSYDSNVENSIEIYPTLVQDILYIKNLNFSQNSWISIVDAKGQIIKTLEIAALAGSNAIQLENLNPGIYFLSVVNDSHRQTKKFVKQ